jgi:ATP/maltotriose-dependent transcriptional regulator MalT
VGPAGFCKTALLADWARRSGRAVAWLSLGTADNDPVRFWRHVAAALVNELAAVPGEVVLVLDDYHLIEAPAVHESVVFLLEHFPAGLRLAVACRADQLRFTRLITGRHRGASVAAAVPGEYLGCLRLPAARCSRRPTSAKAGGLGDGGGTGRAADRPGA